MSSDGDRAAGQQLQGSAVWRSGDCGVDAIVDFALDIDAAAGSAEDATGDRDCLSTDASDLGLDDVRRDGHVTARDDVRAGGVCDVGQHLVLDRVLDQRGGNADAHPNRSEGHADGHPDRLGFGNLAVGLSRDRDIVDRRHIRLADIRSHVRGDAVGRSHAGPGQSDCPTSASRNSD